MRKCIGLNNHSGMALLVVLAVISVLLAAALKLARTTGESAMATSRIADRFMAREQAMAGIHLAMALLADDAAGSDIDSVQENWAQPDKLAGAVQAMGYDKDELRLDIQDELGKLQINALIKEYPGRELNPDQYRIWERFFETLTPEPVAQVNCIQDWLDHRDDEAVTGLSGAESDYYLSLDTPYQCANRPFTHIFELFLVKGITPGLFEGDLDLAEEEGKEPEPISIEEVITVHGLEPQEKAQSRYRFSGRVNINTAPEPVIRALLPREAADRAEEMVKFRQEQGEDGDVFTNLLDKGWVTQVIDLTGKEKQAFDSLVRYDSDLFRVHSVSTVNQADTGITALIHRTKDKASGKWSCRILQIKKGN